MQPLRTKSKNKNINNLFDERHKKWYNRLHKTIVGGYLYAYYQARPHAAHRSWHLPSGKRRWTHGEIQKRNLRNTCYSWQGKNGSTWNGRGRTYCHSPLRPAGCTDDWNLVWGLQGSRAQHCGKWRGHQNGEWSHWDGEEGNLTSNTPSQFWSTSLGRNPLASFLW